MDKVKEHYITVADECGSSKQSTMKDTFIRDKEVQKIEEVLRILTTRALTAHSPRPAILEIGCGNGYTAEHISQHLHLPLTGIDYCRELLEIAKQRSIPNVVFKEGTVLRLDFADASFDIVFTERCLVNLDTWEKQQQALEEIRRILKKGGIFIMMECFVESLHSLNAAREAVGLEKIPQPFHNVFFGREAFLKFVQGKFVDCTITHPEWGLGNCEHFLSSYYFGSKVLYPALAAGKKELEYNNKFVEFFSHMPPYGNYGYVNMFVLKKV